MSGKPAYEEPISTTLRRRPGDNKEEIARTVRWIAISALFIFLTLIVLEVLSNRYTVALVVSIGILPILVSILWIRQGTLSLPSAILAVTLILLIAYLGFVGYGIHDVGMIGFPVVLIVAGLILRDKVISYLTALIAFALAGLAFGDILGFYEPRPFANSDAEDFLFALVIILVAGNAIRLLVGNIHKSLALAEQEIAIREKVEHEREELIRQLRLKNQELDRFALTVSHDLKTPIITIAGFLGYLEKDARAGDTERVQRNITQINDAAKKMGNLVDEILDLSRVGRLINPPSSAPFEEIAREALAAAEGLLKARQVEVRMEAIFPFVHVDRVRIVQVIQNLVVNAIKFMGGQEHPIIEIGFEEKNGEHIFFVRDNGIGIEPQHQEQVFELFNKLDTNTDGTGIGLALVKRIVEVHGGRIWVQSTAGKGSTFFFTLANNNHKETA
jgi:signal transduction histidine kinase